MSNGTTQHESLSPEEFKVRVLKQRFAERVAEYEDFIANLITQNAQLQGQNEQLSAELSAVSEPKANPEA
jgi:hypothetical protein